MLGGYVYILSNFTRTTFYIGVTSNLGERLRQHMNGEGSAFTRKYNLKYLVYVEAFDRITDAIAREKQLKKWHRDWKIHLIKSMNPHMKDLSDELLWER
jgi:putative endonuclease